MPLLVDRTAEKDRSLSVGGCRRGIWSPVRDEITSDRLQRFWSNLPLQAREEMLRINKQLLFEHARKNLYCSRCNGLLLESYTQFVVYGKSFLSLSQECAGSLDYSAESELDKLQDPAVHPWGGLAITKDGMLTLLSCYIHATSLRTLQSVFDCAQARERERELLYPDACGGGGRGWVSQGMVNYGRGHGIREICALHTVRLSCDTLVDFWTALSEETRSSLLRMKEEDFIERLMFRFDSKRFCRDCRRNVIREFKELKELKRMRREPCCTSWFCVADTDFIYEVTDDTVRADWQQLLTDALGTYHHFEWAVGTAEGKYDIFNFEDVGLKGKVQISGLNLECDACFITLRAWKNDGRCTEICVKAHGLKGEPCVHRSLIVGDGLVTIRPGECIRSFFEFAEEAEEEDDEDATDKDGNELDSEASRPQKHAKSPELAREFLVDAATVIFKEQVEKAFREGTARQNAHSTFVCVSLKLLEERLHVACKEVVTLEKQTRLLEEEEKERREIEERKERRRAKEKEKKLRRKERLKEKEKERKHVAATPVDLLLNVSPSGSTSDDSANAPDTMDLSIEHKDNNSSDLFPEMSTDRSWEKPSDEDGQKTDFEEHMFHGDMELADTNHFSSTADARASNENFAVGENSLQEQIPNWPRMHGKIGFKQDDYSAPSTYSSSVGVSGLQRFPRERPAVNNSHNPNSKFCERLPYSINRLIDRTDSNPCSCGHQGMNDGHHVTTTRYGREVWNTSKTASSLDLPRSFCRTLKNSKRCYGPENVMRRSQTGKTSFKGHVKQVWEPTNQKLLDKDRSIHNSESQGNQTDDVKEGIGVVIDSFTEDHVMNSGESDILNNNGATNSNGCVMSKKLVDCTDCRQGEVAASVSFPSKSNTTEPVLNVITLSDSISCLSDSTMSSLSTQNMESSSTSDSEDASQELGGPELLSCVGSLGGGKDLPDGPKEPPTILLPKSETDAHFPMGNSIMSAHYLLPSQEFQPLYSQQMQVPFFPPPVVGYRGTVAASWVAPPAGFVPFPQPGHYLYPGHVGYGVPLNACSDLPLQHNFLYPFSARVHDVDPNSLNNGIYRGSTYGSTESSIPMRNQSVRIPLEKPNAKTLVAPNDAPKSNLESSPFSLFHFGGPVVSAAGSTVKAECGRACSLIPVLSGEHPGGCSKEETMIEEYRLFSSRSDAATLPFF